MRERFNNAHIHEKSISGELSVVVIENRHPALPLAKEPHCTRSEMISYRDSQNFEIARAHRYLRSDGSIGLSGLPDPKRLILEGIMYRLEKGS